MNSEIPGTRPRRQAWENENNSQEETSSQDAAPTQENISASHQIIAEENIVRQSSSLADDPANFNAKRRELFSSIVPAFGEGLVKLLRASNNLKRDFEEEP